MDEPTLDLEQFPTLLRLRDELFSAFAAEQAASSRQAATQRRRRRSPAELLLKLPGPAIAALTAVLAVLLASALLLTSSGGRAAWAVQLRADGSVQITLRELVGVDEANARLRALGIPVTVQRLQPSCGATGTLDRRHSTLFILEHVLRSQTGIVGHGGERWVIDVRAIPRGDTLALVAALAPPAAGTQPFAYAATLYRGRAPACLAPGTFSRR